MNSGLDPEALVTSNGFAVPASLFLPEPTRLAHGALNHVSFDNAAAEFRPAHTRCSLRLTSRLFSLYRGAQVALHEAKRSGKVVKDATFTVAPAAPLADRFRGFKSVSAFGCSPSYVLDDEYGQQASMPYVSAGDTPWRSAGFHVHQETNPNTVQANVAVLDGLMGLTDVLMNNKLGFERQSQIRRLTLGYGKAGEYRTRSVGDKCVLEYRTLSPWPLTNPIHVRRILRASRAVCRQPLDTLLAVLNEYPERAAITLAINKSDASMALKLQATCYKAWRQAMRGQDAF